MSTGNLAAILPKETDTVRAIYALWKGVGDKEARRSYLGMSSIGKECDRSLWYMFRHCAGEDFSGRMYRLFQRGKNEEITFINELRGIGCEVHEADEAGAQFGFSALGGHFRGHMDASALGVPEAPRTWHVCEFKTHSSKSFAELVKHGVEKSKPEHFSQMVAYMRYSGMERALYLAVNKDTDELYSERVRYDAKRADAIEAKAKRIIEATMPPERIAERSDDFRCRFCAARTLCHGGAGDTEPAVSVPALSCRQCCHATPVIDGDCGLWRCEKHGKTLSDAEQSAPCKDLLFIPGLIVFADVVDSHKDGAGNDVIEFKNKTDGAVWYHGSDSGAGHYTAKDLTTLCTPLVGCTQTKMLKKTLGAEFTQVTPDVLVRYSHDRVKYHWKGRQEALPKAWEKLFGSGMPEPILTAECPQWSAAEFTDDRLAVVWPDGIAEIRENLPF